MALIAAGNSSISELHPAPASPDDFRSQGTTWGTSILALSNSAPLSSLNVFVDMILYTLEDETDA